MKKHAKEVHQLEIVARAREEKINRLETKVESLEKKVRSLKGKAKALRKLKAFLELKHGLNKKLVSKGEFDMTAFLGDVEKSEWNTLLDDLKKFGQNVKQVSQTHGACIPWEHRFIPKGEVDHVGLLLL